MRQDSARDTGPLGTGRSESVTSEHAVRLVDVTKRYGIGTTSGILAVDNVSLTLKRGEVLALLGPSGCGKSTILRMVGGLLAPTEGSIFLGADIVTEPSPLTGIMFQRPVLFPWLTVLENVLLPLRVAGFRRHEHSDKASDLINMVGLEGFADSYPWQLSGGMQQRVAICRMLINEPELLLLDEPFGALDEMTREYMDAELRQIIVERNRSAILVTHNPLEAAFVADRVIVLSARPGRIAGQVAVPLGEHRPRSLFSSDTLHGYVNKVRDLFEAGQGTEGEW